MILNKCTLKLITVNKIKHFNSGRGVFHKMRILFIPLNCEVDCVKKNAAFEYARQFNSPPPLFFVNNFNVSRLLR